jgi:hypothetical protein
MLYDSTRHEALRPIPWNEGRARGVIERIVTDTEEHFSPDRYWPVHPRDMDGEDTTRLATSLYFGACGVIWALEYLESVGAVSLSRSYSSYLEPLLARNRAWLESFGSQDFASFMMGDTPIIMMAHGHEATTARAEKLAALIESNLDNPTRELMWGSPGTLLASLFLHERTGEARWATLFRDTAAKLWSQLQWSSLHGCSYWTQDLYGRRCTCLDAVHGFVATASPLIRGRHLLDAETWESWERCIVNTVERTASWDAEMANWRVYLDIPEGQAPRMLMQFCHGAPGFVVCLADIPSAALDSLLTAAGAAIWTAGPLTKGSNLCHGTGGNGYAFLKLFRRTGDPLWLVRARAFAMHGIAQTEADALRFGQMRYSLWTGDLGFAIYLWHCLHGTAAFPTLDTYYD